MSKIAFVFPGQGSQYCGMGKDFYDEFKEAKQIYELASNVTNLDVEAICFEENEQIHQTEYTQIAMLTTEAAILKVVESMGVHADVTAGLSLGEYGALIATNAITLEDAFKLIRLRGIYMQNAYPTGGAMSAILGGDKETIEKVCNETEGIVSIANYNCPGQIVITGEEDAVNRASDKLKEAGVKRCMPLKVSGPFHSELLKDAGEKLQQDMQNINWEELSIPYYCNVTAEKIEASNEIEELLTKQVSHSVRWEQSIHKMIEDGVDIFVELGPGKTLTNFMKKINKEVTAYHIGNVEELKEVVEQLKQVQRGTSC